MKPSGIALTLLVGLAYWGIVWSWLFPVMGVWALVAGVVVPAFLFVAVALEPSK